MEDNQMELGWEALYALPDKRFIRIHESLDDPEYGYGYDYFGEDYALIDGGVFEPDREMTCLEDVLKEALDICGYPTDASAFRLDDGSGPIDLEGLGFTGF